MPASQRLAPTQAGSGSVYAAPRPAAPPQASPPPSGQDASAGARAAPSSPTDLAARGRAEFTAGRIDDARALLSEAFVGNPADLTLARDLQRIAERQGRWADYLELGEVLTESLAAQDPIAASARFRHLAEVARTRLSRSDRAAVLLEKGLSLAPQDPALRKELVELWASRLETAPRAMAAWLETARNNPGDGHVLAAVASLCSRMEEGVSRLDMVRLKERRRQFASTCAFVAPGLLEPPPPSQPSRAIPPGLRDRLALPGAAGPLAKLLALLAPWLESLFPADLTRRGASPSDRLLPPRGARLRAALDKAMISLGGRAYAPFLTRRPGIEIALENTHPPALVASAGVEELPAPQLNFLAARSLDLLTAGFSLLGKFAPRDVAILLELSCRFAGGSPPPLGLPAQKAGAYLSALVEAVPPAARRSGAALGQPASEELGSTDPATFVAALRSTANRVALVHAGDPGPALAVLSSLERKRAGMAEDPLSAPEVRELAGFALSDDFLELRLSVS
jgi:tetratricopeptide (TPR) repeat protein